MYLPNRSPPNGSDACVFGQMSRRPRDGSQLESTLFEGTNARGLEVSVGTALSVLNSKVLLVRIVSLLVSYCVRGRRVAMFKYSETCANMQVRSFANSSKSLKTHLVPTSLCCASNEYPVAGALPDVEAALTNARTRVAVTARNADQSCTPVADTGIEPSIGIRAKPAEFTHDDWSDGSEEVATAAHGDRVRTRMRTDTHHLDSTAR